MVIELFFSRGRRSAFATSQLTSAIWKSTLSTTSPPGLVLASNTLLYSELKWTRCISSGNLGGTSLVSTRKHYEALEREAPVSTNLRPWMVCSDPIAELSPQWKWSCSK